MAWYNFSFKKNILEESEKDIIKNAFKSISKEMFQSLYFDSSEYINYHKYGFKSKEEGVNSRTNSNIEQFLKNSNYLSYVIIHSERWWSSFKKLSDEGKLSSDVMLHKDKILNALGGLTTLKARLDSKEYIIRYNHKLCYPAAICQETPEDTEKWFKELLEPLLHLQ